ncbi:MAG: hypothetical protein L0Z53_17410 [Acidobacteriales bacterium]|nr:hypothetical protein [Terriglobales bacterium]
MIRTTSLALVISLLLTTAGKADWKLDAFYKYARGQAVSLSKTGQSTDIDRVRKALNDQLAKYKFRGTIRVLLEPRRKQAGIRVDAESFVMIIMTERGDIIYSEVVER